MKLNTVLALIPACIAFQFSHHSASSQVLEVSSGITPGEMMEILVGSGISYDNVTYTGNEISRGIFWGGPGISEPYSNNSENIALVPLTSIPVGINTINCGNPYNCSQNCENCQYFINNSQFYFTQYDAFTKVLTAWSNVEPLQTYHIKLAIGDGIDHAYDSGTFIQAGSFCSGPVTGLENERPYGYGFNVFPVPANDVIRIVSENGPDFNVILYGPDGRMYSKVSGNSRANMDISHVPSGIYFLKITDKNGVTTKKISIK